MLRRKFAQEEVSKIQLPVLENKTKKKNSRLILLIFIILISVIVLVSTAWYYIMLEKKLYQERQSFFELFTRNTSEYIDLAIERYWSNNDLYQQYLNMADIKDYETLRDALQIDYYKDKNNDIIVMLLDDKGDYYSIDGHEDCFGTDFPVTMDGNERQIIVTELPLHKDEEVYIFFFEKLETPIYLEDKETITHIASAVNMKKFEELLETKEFKAGCNIYLVSSDGNILFRNKNSKDFLKNENIYDSILDDAFVINGGTKAELEKSLKDDNNGYFEIMFQNNNWFFSKTKIETINCYLVAFVSADIISSHAESLTVVSFFYIIFIFCTIAALIALLLTYIKKGSKESEVMLQQVRIANVELEKAMEEARRANDAKSEFLSYMSHDIRTPLNGIVGMVTIAHNHVGNSVKMRDCLWKIEDASKHLVNLLNDVLDLSRIESGKTRINHQSMDIRELIKDCSAIVEGQLSLKEYLEFVVEQDEFSTNFIYSDELHLRQILINVLSNAVKFTPDGGKICFRIREFPAKNKDKIGIVFEVEDNGIGMEQAFLEKIWEPFEQARSGNTVSQQGTGLGMTITKKFVDMMDGNIAVTSKLGEGSTFVISFLFDKGESIKAETEDVIRDLSGLHILLVDDNELNLEIAREILEMSGANVMTADNGDRAIEIFKNSGTKEYDLILLDVMMPKKDGLQTARELRQLTHPDSKTVPIVALSANAFDEDVVATREAGMDAHLAKPIDVPNVLRIINSITRNEN